MKLKGKKLSSINRVLDDWYGRKRASLEMVSHLSDPVQVGDAVSRVVNSLMTPEEVKMLQLKEKWEEIAGIQISKISNPININNKTIYVEVSHPVWLRELNSSVNELLTKKINSMFGKRFCNNIRFVPAGRQDYSFNGGF